jgi:hypothetical protein
VNIISPASDLNPENALDPTLIILLLPNVTLHVESIKLPFPTIYIPVNTSSVPLGYPLFL